jgi:hypothetical protein
MATDLSDPTVVEPEGRPVELNGIRWETLEAILNDIGDQRTGFAYDRGRLECQTSLLWHIRWETLRRC